MNVNKFEGILPELRKPFHPSAIEWKPQSVTKDGAKGMAIAYADMRAYMNRLDEVCGMDWSVTFTPWGDRIVCHLTIGGVTRSSTGESDSQSERSEIGGTSAEAQAFKRACAMFGLGRYLYQLPSAWVEMDGKQFSANGKAKLAGIIATHYRREMDKEPEVVTTVTEESDEDLRKLFDNAGAELYGEQWEQVRRHNAERISGGKTDDASQLDSASIKKLLQGMNNLKSRRKPLTVGQPVGVGK